MNTIDLDIPEGAARASRLAALRRQMAEEIRGRNPEQQAPSSVPTAQVGTPDGIGPWDARVVSSTRSCSSLSSTSTPNSASGTADAVADIAARRKRSIMARVRPSSGRDTSPPSATSGVEDLSAKMARLHSPMKDVDDVVTPHVATCVGRTLNMAFSLPPNVTERKSVVRTSAKEASGPNLSGRPYQAVRVSSACVLSWAMGTGAGAGT